MLLQRWKLILSNWNNCFNENDKNKKEIDIDSLHHIVTYLRQNLNLDQSKSSLFEAQTVQEFIQEKYPEFVFENGTVEPGNQDEIYFIASLLLYFVCVNSKDTYVKHAMCSKLSSEDQEIILKFSRHLMDCSVISCRDVQSAITEACGQDEATMEVRHSVSETPPVLRSMHGEVRRLQAALDAERFDRNYLQEELIRTNVKLDKLLKEKEKYKLDIVNLKAKISLYCGEESETRAGDNIPDKTAKLTRQLQLLEEKLVDTQGQLDDVSYERDAYKAKVDDLKHERDKWLSLSQQESSRVCQVSEALEAERRALAAARDELAELRAHLARNRRDDSTLECDDPDTSLRSLPHNTSICSEACANVVEVQLGEERARVVGLQQQIQSLQEQINELNKQAESEKNTYELIMSDRENSIVNLKHRINEEIEDKNNLKSHYDNEITKLNNEINELEQRLKENDEQSRAVIEKNIGEIQSLQEENLSLRHRLNDETAKLDNVIKSLQNELENEKQSKSSMKDGYENHLMKLNEKVLNRNNELVELQNSIFEKGEKIETLQIELRKIKEAKDELLNKYHVLDEQKLTADDEIRQKTEEIKIMQTEIQKSNNMIDDLQSEVSGLKKAVSDMSDNCKLLEDTKEELTNNLKSRDDNIEELNKEIETLKATYTKHIEKLTIDLDEMNATANSLQTQLKNEIQFKIELQNELEVLKSSREQDMDEIKALNGEINKYIKHLEDKERIINSMDLYIQEEKKINEISNKKINELTEDINNKFKQIKALEDKIIAVNDSLTEQARINEAEKEENRIKMDNLMLEKEEYKLKVDNFLVEKEEFITKIDNLIIETEESRRKIDNLMAEKEELVEQNDCLNNKKLELENEVAAKLGDIEVYKGKVEEMDKNAAKMKEFIEFLEKTLIFEGTKYKQLEASFVGRITKVMTRLTDTETKVASKVETLKYTILEKQSKIIYLTADLDKLNKQYEVTKGNLSKYEKENKEKKEMIKLLNKELENKNNIEKECEFKEKNINKLKNRIKTLNKTIKEKTDALKVTEDKLNKEVEDKINITYESKEEIKKMNNKVSELETLNREFEKELNKVVNEKTRAIEALKHENEQLQFTIEEENSNHEVLIRAKDVAIENLEQTVRINAAEYKTILLTLDSHKLDTEILLKKKAEDISKLYNKIDALQNNIKAIEEENSDLKDRLIELEVCRKQLEDQLSEEKCLRDALETEKEQTIKVLVTEREALAAEKQILSHEITEEKSNKKIAEDEKNVLLTEKIQIKQQLNKELDAVTALQRDAENLAKLLNEEIIEKEELEKLKDALNAEKALTEDRLKESEAVKSEQCEEINNLKEIIDRLQAECDEAKQTIEEYERSLKDKDVKLDKLETNYDYLLRENQDVISVNDTLKNDLDEVQTSLVKLIDENNACNIKMANLEDNLRTEQSNRKDIDEQNNNLKAEIEKLKENSKELNELLKDAVKTINLREAEVDKNKAELASRDEIIECLTQYKDSLLNEKETLIQEKELLIQEKNSLIATFSEEKSARDVLETEKNGLVDQLNDLNDKIKQLNDNYIDIENEFRIKNEEFTKTEQTLGQLKLSHDNVEKNNQQILNILNTGMNRIIEKCKADTFNNTVVQNLIKEINLDTDAVSKCTTLCQIVDTLSSELENMKNIEKMLQDENKAVGEMKNAITMKQQEVLGLQTEIQKLEQLVNEYKIELTKQTETYALTMDSKIKDIQTLQQENQTLHHELNEVKTQLEVKVHSLKEKLVDNENLTEKLKTTYECQIDNLNVMVTKLTNYMKEKSVELETLRKEKDQLLNTVADSCKVIKTLEEDMKVEKQNLEKIVTEFDSERQVLKNMVTVTESVMDDQKNTLNNIISDHLKTIETLQDDNKELKRIIEGLQSKILAIETANSSLMSLLKKEREIKGNVENESEILREYLDDIMKELTNQIGVNSSLEGQKRDIIKELDMCNNDIIELKRNINELKVHNETLVIELQTASDKLCIAAKEKSLLEAQVCERDDNITERNQQITALNEQVKTLNEQIATLNTNKEKIELEKTEYVTKIEQLNDKLNILLKEKEELQLEKKQFVSQNENSIEKVKEVNDKINILIQDKEKLELEKTQLATENKDQMVVIKEVNEKLNILLKEKEELELKNNQLLIENNEHINVIGEVNDKINVLLKEKEELEVEKNNLESVNKEHVIKIDEINNTVNILVKEKEELAVQNKEYNNQIVEVNEKLNRKKYEIEAQKKEILDKVDEANCRVNDLLKEKEELEVEKKKMVAENDEKINALLREKYELEVEKKEYVDRLKEMDNVDSELVGKLKQDNEQLVSAVEESKSVISNLEQLIKQELQHNKQLSNDDERQSLLDKCSSLLQYQRNAKELLQQKENELTNVQKEIEHLKQRIDLFETDGRCKDSIISKMSKEKDAIISTISKELVEERTLREKLQKDLEAQKLAVSEVKNDMEIRALRKENEQLLKAIGQQDTLAAPSEERAGGQPAARRESQVLTPPSPGLVRELQAAVRDKTRAVTTLHGDVAYLKALVADSETKLLDATRELAAARDDLRHLDRLKKALRQKNDEIADLKRHVAKLSAAESGAAQIMSVSAKYRAVIAERLAELRAADALRELTNTPPGAATDLERFLEAAAAAPAARRALDAARTALERRAARAGDAARAARAALGAAERTADPARLLPLERAHGAALLDLADTVLALCRWASRAERAAGAGAAPERAADVERRLAELEEAFPLVAEEAARAARAGAGAAPGVAEVRAEYEDKLNRMKAKMKDLFNEQMVVIKQKQRDDIGVVERELQKTRDKLEESRRAYEKHIKELTRELWSVGEKYLVKNDEAEWLRKKQRSGSLMSLQHVHSSGLVNAEPPNRPSDAASLRSLPVGNKREERGLQVFEEEGEVFDNRWLGELSTPRRGRDSLAGRDSHAPRDPHARLSELKWRNSLCPPHLKSSYPAETQFAPALDEDDIKAGLAGKQRKEVGITAYKKPGPPTPSKQAGRLSATDSELRELRVENEPLPDRKTSTPARIRAFLSFKKNDTNDGTPRTRRLSNIFRKK